MTTTATTWGQFATTATRWERRTPESLVCLWLALFMMSVLLVIVGVSAALMGNPMPLASVVVLCCLSALAAICVTHVGLRDVHIYRQRVTPMGQIRLRMQDMARGWCLSVFLLCLSMAVSVCMSSVSSLAKVLPVMLLVLFCHTAWVCAVHAWWGIAHPLHLVIPVLTGLALIFWPSMVFDAWRQAGVGFWLLAAIYGLGALVSVYRQALASIETGSKPLYRSLSPITLGLDRMVARGGFMEQGDLKGKPWTAFFVLGSVAWQVPSMHIGDHWLLEPWGAELSHYEIWRLGFLTLLLMPALRTDLWHWRIVLSPQGPVRRNFGLKVILSTGRFVALCVGFWAVCYLVMQLFFENQSLLSTLSTLALYAPTVFVDCWVAISLATCLKGALKSWQALASVLFLVISPVWFLAGFQSDFLKPLGRHEWVYGAFMTLVAGLLTLYAQRIWRKKDLAQAFRASQSLIVPPNQ